MTTDRTRIRKILNGDRQAFRELINDHQRLVGHIVFRLVPNASDREEVCQDVFVKVYQSLGNFEYRCKLSTWIGRIAYNACLNYLKKRKLPLLDDLPDVRGVYPPGANGTDAAPKIDRERGVQPLPDEIIISRETAQFLRREIEQLPPKFRAVITMFHLDEMSYTEIGEIMDLPQGTVKSHLFRARKMLKVRLTQKRLQEALGGETHEE